MAHFGPGINLFFQYKVPYSVDKSRARKRGVKRLSGNLFRFNIYHNCKRFDKVTKRRLPSQYELLWDWSRTERFVFYTVPVFNTNQRFHQHYRNIIPCSRHFNVNQMVDPATHGFNDESHSIYFSDGGHIGYMYSDNPTQLESTDLTLGTKLIGDAAPVVLEGYVEDVFSKLINILGGIERRTKLAYFLTDKNSMPTMPSRRFFYDLESLDDRAFYVRNLLREHLKVDWVIAKYPENLYFTSGELFN